ncbi:HAD-IA family hydrolase [Pendulispora rubella]|uniref:HAD-IA family hydrolase n=1 Tax=Pendulispora rubella TaxID=2741070 RepID=A0ABZ2LD82_9BACT
MTLGLPSHVRACLFDLDGVLTQTATEHAAAWTEMFDEYLRARAQQTGEVFVPFAMQDYELYVDGKARADGVQSFLASRGISLPEGDLDDAPEHESIHGLSNRKNELLLRRIHTHGVKPYEGSVRYVRAVRAAGLRTAVVSASANCHDVLVGAGIESLFDVRIDGIVALRDHLHGKPAPDTYLAGARALGVEAGSGAVFEDALAGVEAGRAGNFGYVVGVDRVGQAEELRKRGAHVVVGDLGELLAVGGAP